MIDHQYYRCGDIVCANKGPSGERNSRLCDICDSYAMTAIKGWSRRQAHHEAPMPLWTLAYAAVDALGALAEGNHVTYIFFRALHHVTRAQHGRTFGAVSKHINGLFGVVPALNQQTAFLGKEWTARRKCSLWCGRKASTDCAESCSIARDYVQHVYRLGSQPALDHARKIIDSFAQMTGPTRCSAFSVAGDILGLDPVSCAALGQYTRKAVDGVEISLIERVERMIQARTAGSPTVARAAGLVLAGQGGMQ